MFVAEFYSVYRSLRRGATLETLNVQIPETVINMNNKWRKEMRSNGYTISMPIIQRYTDAGVANPTLVQFLFYCRDRWTTIGGTVKGMIE